MNEPGSAQSTLEYVLGPEHGASLRQLAINTARFCGVLAAALGVVVMVGWFLDSAPILSVLPGASTMKFNAALTFVVAGTSLFLTTVEGRRSATAASVAATFVVLTGAASLFEIGSSIDLGIDHFFVRDSNQPLGSAPGRMSGPTSLAFILSGAGLLLLDDRVRVRPWLAQALAGGVAVIAILALGEHLYLDRRARDVTFFAGMSIHGAVAFLALALGAIAARPHAGIGPLLFSPTLTSKVARRWLLGALAIPLSLGFVTHALETSGVLDRASASSLLVGLMGLVMAAAVVIESALSHRLEGRRLEWERERGRLVTELELAMGEVRSLSGLLPICSHCKRIRDDGGEWQRLEAYISDNSEAKFSHSFCPDCLQKHYGDLF